MTTAEDNAEKLDREVDPRTLPIPEDGGWHRGDWMQTFTGRRFYPLSPTVDDIDPLDIAHALSLVCRYGGHISEFYSVAEHCLLMSRWVEREAAERGMTPRAVRLYALEALLHDGSEAYVGDMVRPLKHSGAVDAYKVVEDAITLVIAERFALTVHYDADTSWHPKHELIKEADTRILLTERTALMPNYKPSDRWSVDGLDALPVRIGPMTPADAEAAYLRRLTELGVELDELA